VALIDTDSDPDLIDLPIPGNDDAMRAVDLIVRELADAVIEGKTGRSETKGEEPAAPRAAERPRRSSRTQFRAEDAPAAPGSDAPAVSDAVPSGPAPTEAAPPETLAAHSG
jgi:small subunit ribosomal protein S2